MVLVTEIGDWRRFDSPPQLMSYLGLVPSEHSSGSRERRGRITKAGNSFCRHVLVQAAWSYRHRPHLGPALKKRQRGQPPSVISQSWKAQHRLHRLYGRIAFKKVRQVAAVAVAREFVGFLWATMRELEVERSTTTAASDRSIADEDWRRPTAILLGNEAAGLSMEELSACDSIVRIPHAGAVGSLNAATAAGIVLYEAARCRGFEAN